MLRLFRNTKGIEANSHLTFDFRHLTWKLKLLCLFVIAMLFSSCSAEKRLHRLVALHPELVTKDTIRIQDTTLIPELRIDTLVHYSRLQDTITIEKEKLMVRIHQVRDTVYIQAVQKEDTVIHSKEIPVDKVIHKNPHIKEEEPGIVWLDVIVLVLMGSVIFVLIKLDKRSL